MARADPPAPPTAVVEESACIGCALCIEACPVDAIVGAEGFLHAVIAAECTGCGWCVPACPVDCIAMLPREESWTRATRLERAALYRRRYRARAERLERAARAQERARSEAALRRREIVERALERARRLLREDPG
jgi:electron transport complex protein RnfB